MSQTRLLELWVKIARASCLISTSTIATVTYYNLHFLFQAPVSVCV